MKSLTIFSILLCSVSAFAQTSRDHYSLRRVNPDLTIDSFNISSATGLYNWNNELYFLGYDSSEGTEVFVLKNHSQITPVTDMSTPGLFRKKGGNFVAFAGKLYFAAYDKNNQKGRELWEYDGNNAPSLAYEFYPGTANGFKHNNSINYNNKLYISGYFPPNEDIFCTYDPATKKVTKLLQNPHFSLPLIPVHITVFNNKLCFAAEDTTGGNEFFEYDPATNQYQVFDIRPNYPWGKSSTPKNFTVFNNKLYFTATDTSIGSMYVYDGINPPKKLSTKFYHGYLNQLHVYNNELYLTALKDTAIGNELYKYDPIADSITLIHNINGSKSSSPTGMYNHNGSMFFQAWDEIHGCELWMYNGVDTPKLIEDINPGANSSWPGQFTTVDSFLYFVTTNPLPPDTANHTSITEVAAENSVTLFPNPAGEHVQMSINLSKDATLNIFITNINGKKVYSRNNYRYTAPLQTINIPLHNLPGGSYIYSVADAENRQLATGKLLVQ